MPCSDSDGSCGETMNLTDQLNIELNEMMAKKKEKHVRTSSSSDSDSSSTYSKKSRCKPKYAKHKHYNHHKKHKRHTHHKNDTQSLSVPSEHVDSEILDTDSSESSLSNKHKRHRKKKSCVKGCVTEKIKKCKDGDIVDVVSNLTTDMLTVLEMVQGLMKELGDQKKKIHKLAHHIHTSSSASSSTSASDSTSCANSSHNTCHSTCNSSSSCEEDHGKYMKEFDEKIEQLKADIEKETIRLINNHSATSNNMVSHFARVPTLGGRLT